MAAYIYCTCVTKMPLNVLEAQNDDSENPEDSDYDTNEDIYPYVDLTNFDSAVEYSSTPELFCFHCNVDVDFSEIVHFLYEKKHDEYKFGICPHCKLPSLIDRSADTNDIDEIKEFFYNNDLHIFYVSEKTTNTDYYERFELATKEFYLLTINFDPETKQPIFKFSVNEYYEPYEDFYEGVEDCYPSTQKYSCFYCKQELSESQITHVFSIGFLCPTCGIESVILKKEHHDLEIIRRNKFIFHFYPNFPYIRLVNTCDKVNVDFEDSVKAKDNHFHGLRKIDGKYCDHSGTEIPPFLLFGIENDAKIVKENLETISNDDNMIRSLKCIILGSFTNWLHKRSITEEEIDEEESNPNFTHTIYWVSGDEFVEGKPPNKLVFHYTKTFYE